MDDYLFVFHGGDMPADPEEGAKVMARWGAWMEELGTAIVAPGAPVENATMVGPDSTRAPESAQLITGYLVVKAASIETAVQLAKGCPIHENNGTVQIARAVQFSPN
ncbi:MAG: YciI family protein [Cognatishimia sp.]